MIRSYRRKYDIVKDKMVHTERRKFVRRDFFELPYTLMLHLAEAWSGEVPPKVEPKNLCAGGMKFQTSWKIPVFEELEISLLHKENEKSIAKIKGKVVRLEEIDIGTGDKTYTVAIEFKPEFREKLENQLPC